MRWLIAKLNRNSFGSPNLAETGYSSMLASAHTEFYKADNIPAMVAAWRTMNPTHHEGVLMDKTGLDFVDEGQTVFNNLRRQYDAGNSEGRLITLITRLQSMIKGIEHGLGAALARVPGANVVEKIEALETASPFNNPHIFKVKKVWEKLILRQYNLFQDYYLWTDPADAFASFTS